MKYYNVTGTFKHTVNDIIQYYYITNIINYYNVIDISGYCK